MRDVNNALGGATFAYLITGHLSLALLTLAVAAVANFVKWIFERSM